MSTTVGRVVIFPLEIRKSFTLCIRVGRTASRDDFIALFETSIPSQYPTSLSTELFSTFMHSVYHRAVDCIKAAVCGIISPHRQNPAIDPDDLQRDSHTAKKIVHKLAPRLDSSRITPRTTAAKPPLVTTGV